ncbi:MAG: hypothetical protein E7491_09340 [Ruminococcaceae bacterium]|nr:hypothetical protein [Oscillospiraceae bacterium]
MGRITYQTLRSFTYSNDKLIKGDIKGLVVEFTGLGASQMRDDTERARKLAEKGVIHIVPYNDPWCWMNDQAIAYTDEIIDVLFEHYNLPDDLPIVSTGGSMGGLSSLVYTRYAKRTPVTCVSNCPVCDLPYHYTERPDLPRTLYNAFFYAEDLDEAMRKHSPLHLVKEMPDIEYHLFHCEWDTAVRINMHSIPFYEAMKEGHNITFDKVPERGHCSLSPEAAKKYEEYIFSAFN